MTAYFSYDTNTPDREASTSIGQYALTSIMLTLGNYAFTQGPASTTPATLEVNVPYKSYLSYTNTASFTGPVFINGVAKNYEDISWEFTELHVMHAWKNGDQPFTTSDSIPTLFPDINTFLDTKYSIYFAEQNNGSDPQNYFIIVGHLSSITIVPEPLSFYTFFLTMLSFRKFNYYRRK
jgi:hypothetical protein